MSEQANNAEKNNANAHMALETRVNPYDGFENSLSYQPKTVKYWTVR